MTEVAATTQDASAKIVPPHAQNQQLSAKLHGKSVSVQGFFDAAAVKAVDATEAVDGTTAEDANICN